MKTYLSRAAQSSGSGKCAYFLIEILVYLAVVVALLGAGYAAMYRCIDNSIVLRRNADEITSALHAGERWRADVRSATSPVHLETTEAGQVLSFESTRGQISYRFFTNTLFLSVGGGPWTRLLPNVKSSVMKSDPRQYATPWSWELELAPRAKGTTNPSRVRPLFTFIAVPERSLSK